MSYLPRTVSAGGIAVRKGADGILYIALEQQIDDAWGKDVWFIPKGHVEEGESLEMAALREAAEEAGVQDATIIQKIGVKHRPSSHGPNELKEIHYFLMSTEVEELVPTATTNYIAGRGFRCLVM